MSEKFRQDLAKLQTAIAIRNAQILSNPMPHLQKMDEHCYKLLRVLDDVKYALSPDYVFDFWDQNCDKKQLQNPMSIQGEALLRCNKALEILDNYFHK